MMKQKRILTIGGATQDLFLHCENADLIELEKEQILKTFLLLEQGSKIDVKRINYYTGGGATNSAVAFKKLGFDVTAFFKVGNDTQGQFIIDELKNYQIKVHPIISEKQQSGTSFVLPTHNDRIVLAFRGANTELQETDIPINLIKEVDAVYITSLSGQSAKILPSLVKAAKEFNKFVAINPGIGQLKGANLGFLLDSLAYVDVFILNASEAATLLNSKNFNINSYFELLKQYSIKTIVVTSGNEGVYLKHENEIYFKESIKPKKVVNTLGAGDAFGSTLVASLLTGLSIQESIKNGLINATSVIEFEDAKNGLLTFSEIQQKWGFYETYK